MSSEVIDFNTERMRKTDHMVRGTCADGMVRAFAIDATQTVQTAHENHDTAPVVTAALGRLMMGALMTAAMFKEPDELVTFVIQGDGPIGAITVTANCEGQAKGFPANPHVWLPLNSKGKLDVSGAIGSGTLLAVRDIPNEEPYSSRIELVSGEIGEDLTHYFMVSDQVPSSVGVGVLVGQTGDVECAGSFIVQLMPDCPDETIKRIEQNLSAVTSVTDIMREGASPTALLERVLDGLDFQQLDEQPVEFFCGCNEERAARTVLTLGEDEIRNMINNSEPAEVHCHFCGRTHTLSVDKLRELLQPKEDNETQG